MPHEMKIARGRFLRRERSTACHIISREKNLSKTQHVLCLLFWVFQFLNDVVQVIPENKKKSICAWFFSSDSGLHVVDLCEALEIWRFSFNQCTARNIKYTIKMGKLYTRLLEVRNLASCIRANKWMKCTQHALLSIHKICTSFELNTI